jgi:hypothetical protein
MREGLKVLTDEQMDLAIDPLIRPAVDLLREHYIETIESCQGGDGHCCLEPMVRFVGEEIDLIRAMEICLAAGMHVFEGRKVYRKIEQVIHKTNVGRTYEKPTYMIVFNMNRETGIYRT